MSNLNDLTIEAKEELIAKCGRVFLRDLGFSSRTLNPLLQNNYLTIGDIVRAEDNFGAKIYGFGQKALDELEAKIIGLLDSTDNHYINSLFEPPLDLHQISIADLNTVLSEVDLNKPLDWLHLNIDVYRGLSLAGIASLGQLLEIYSSTLKRSGEAVPLYVTNKNVNQSLIALTKSLIESNQVNWMKYWETQGIEVIPKNYKLATSSEQILVKLPRIIRELIDQHMGHRDINQTEKRSERAWHIIERRFGLENPDTLTLDEIGTAFGVSRERIRQIEAKTIEHLRRTLDGSQFIGKNYRVHPEIVLLAQKICALSKSEATHAISEPELLEKVRLVFNIDPNKVKTSLFLLFTLSGISRIEFKDQSLAPIWGSLDSTQQALLERGLKSLDKYLTEEMPYPKTEFEVLQEINKGLKKLEKINLAQIRWLTNLCNTIERREDGTIWGKFEFLKGRGNQAGRILFEARKPMEMTDIIRELNYRLVSLGERKVESRSFSNQISNDDRIVPVGRSGQWGLKSWDDVETGNIVELMEKFLITRNKPATNEEIFSYVSKVRPVSKKSIDVYLASKKNFKKMGYTNWGLSSWADLDNEKNWNREDVAEFVAGFFKKNRIKEIDYKVLKSELIMVANLNEKQAQGVLNSCPAIITRKGEKWGQRFAVFQPDYKVQLAQNGRRAFKKATLRQQIETSVRNILESSPNKQVTLSELLALLQKTYKCHDKTFYRYISDLDFVEYLEIPASRTKLVRIKGFQIGISFPQVQNITNPGLKLKIEHTLPLLTEDYVDIGLFSLSREFEIALKTYIETAISKGKLANRQSIPSNDPKKWKLFEMINSIKDNSIVTDQTVLNYLRLERNERAHGLTPTLNEHQILVNNVQYLAGLYIEYIKLFDDLNSKLI